MDRLKLTIWITLVFFGFGSMLFALHLFDKDSFVIIIFGYYYVLFCVVFNSLLVLILLFILLLKNNKAKTLKSIGVLLINIPIALLYFNIVVNTIH
ncbi:hypothetical protein [uncultured Psychroserpens sp.]|uniref:hypothetical protein n=1 Tax=uncultured Psychroserpens sp. TaxID=255436 RepID=UPI002604A2B3|nr:hypothetical protein [uncultured Psychroserpens sp.]